MGTSHKQPIEIISLIATEKSGDVSFDMLSINGEITKAYFNSKKVLPNFITK